MLGLLMILWRLRNNTSKAQNELIGLGPEPESRAHDHQLSACPRAPWPDWLNAKLCRSGSLLT